VLGNLPRSRPSVRSPNRPASPPEMRAGATDAEEPESERSGGTAGEIESLARAGASAAGEVAGLGLRLAGRAAAALRDAVERR
jgi:hypothetical protein